jgi:hypothetical protein
MSTFRIANQIERNDMRQLVTKDFFNERPGAGQVSGKGNLPSSNVSSAKRPRKARRKDDADRCRQAGH